ncbi:transglutaminase TgpA family protein [Herbiconiux solani]|uniref:transglutaminase TgpA family protein n=1 Tax=Herbiconiux solani TaxID=661329 RepID=UPI0008242F3F|nr:DUF3488 and transglutaminase-like domain-containing protein [Herbiconiux solani]
MSPSLRVTARRAGKTGAWKSTLAVAVCIGAALLGLAPMLQGAGWWFQTMTMVTVLLASMAVLRARGAAEVTVVAVSAIIWGALVVLLYAGDSLWFGLPTLATIGDISNDLAAARESIAVQEIPAIADGPITQLIVMAVGLIAVITDELATGLRTPVLSGIGPLAVLSIAPLVRRTEPDVPVYVLAAVAFLGVIWFSSRIGGRSFGAETRPDGARSPALPVASPVSKGTGRNPGLAIALGAAAVAAMVVLPLVTPGLTAKSLADDPAANRFPSVYATGVDPTIQLGRDLRRSDAVLSLTYSTDAPDGLYLKMVTLGDFTTGTWEPESAYDGVGYDGQDFGTPPGLAADVPTEDSTTSISIAGLRSDWLPMPYPTRQVDELSGDWLLTPSTFTMTDLQGDTRGLNYRTTSLQVSPTAEQLAAAGAVVPDAVRDFLQVPADLPPVIAQTAAEVTKGAATNYDQAVALQEYFRSPQFRYSLSAPESGGYDGDNAQMIAAFLQAKEGYCVHFAASMAVMARTLGIPSRIAVGYSPGQNADSTADGLPVYEVYTDQLHAWPELYFDGIGWLPFEPTPGLDITPPDYSLPDYAKAGAAGAANVPLPSITATGTANQDRADTDGGPAAATGQAAVLEQVRGWGVFALILGLATAIVLLPWAVRSGIRRSRFRRLATDPLPGTLAWSEFEAALDDHRIHRSAGETVADVERRLLADLMLPAEPLERLRRQVEFEQYAPELGVDDETRQRLAAELRELLSSLDAQSESGTRLRARMLPASLWSRRRTPAAAGTLVP